MRIDDIIRPTSVEAAVEMLNRSQGRACFVAGATDIAALRTEDVPVLIDISRLGLAYIRKEGGRYRIGATTTIRNLEESKLSKKLAGGLLAKAAATWGSAQVSNRATIGGNLARGSSIADMAPPLLAMGAVATFYGRLGRRSLPLADFWSTNGKTGIDQELLVEVAIPPLPRDAWWDFCKFTLIGDAVSLVNIAIGIQVDKNRICKWARVALGGVAAVPVRLFQTEQLLTNTRLSEMNLLVKVCQQIKAEIKPIDDLRGSAKYKYSIACTLLRREIEKFLTGLREKQ